MRIIVYQGDENRAKIETEWTDDMFFSPIYEKAKALVSEIVSEMKLLSENEDKTDCSNVLFQRTPNNIIAFCAHRGQGKTTAMKSFARFLAKESTEADFIVLDSVDPAALDSGESIVRVVLSRLFYKLQEKCEKQDNYEFLGKREIMELFSKCYRAIDHINGSKTVDRDEDDLEALASLGNSGRLKKNLQELIELLLETFLNDKKERKASRFLVIPIDDVDISTTDIYRCCEEIRNYLALPNVIILMAADHTQLMHVMYQRYLQNNKDLRECEPENAKEECSKLAFGYLLKLLPVNHIVELPELDKMAEEDWLSLSLEYYVKSGSESYNVFGETATINEDMRQQLTELIYRRTGIIIYDGEDDSADYMPKNMRELTQLLKKIARIPMIDEGVLYGENWEQAEAEAVKLKENIQCYKSYFLESWCMNHMLHEEYTNFLKTVERIERHKKSGTIGWTYRELLGYLCGDRKEKFRNSIVVDDAFCMFISIFLNAWFAEALYDSIKKKSKSRQYSKIADFMGMKGKVSETFQTDERTDRYLVYSFAVPNNIFSAKQLLEWKRKNSSEPLFFSVDGKRVFFDVLNPWDYIVREGSDYYSYLIKEKSNSNVVREINISRQKEWGTVLNTLSNVNIVLQRWKKYLMPGYASPQKLNGAEWTDKVLEEYKKGISKEEIQKESAGMRKEFVERLKDTINSGIKTCVEKQKDELNALQSLFICNEYNMNSYYREYKRKYRWLFVDPSEENVVSQVRDGLMKAVENSTKLPIDPESIYKSRDNLGEEIWKKDTILRNIFYSSKMLGEIMQYFRRTFEKKISLTDAQITEIIKEIKEKYKEKEQNIEQNKEQNIEQNKEQNIEQNKEQEVVIFDKKEDIPAETPVDATPPKTPQKKKKVVVDTEITPQE